MSHSNADADVAHLLEHRAWVRALAGRILRDPNAVDDVEQDTWIAGMRGGPTAPGALRSWLARVAARFALQRVRGERRRARRDVAAAGDRVARSPDEIVAEADAHGRVVDAVLALREPYRTVILLRHFEGLSLADVAARTATPVETVRTRLRRAHERLRATLGGDAASALVILAGGPTVATTGPGDADSVGAARGARRAIRPRTAIVAASLAVAVCVAVAFRETIRGAGTDGDVSHADDVRRPRAPDGVPGSPERDTADTRREIVSPDVDPPVDPPSAAPGSPAPLGGPRAPANAAPDVAPKPRLRDLADGAPLRGVAIEIRRDGGAVTAVTTRADGEIPCDVRGDESIRVPGGEWTHAALLGARPGADVWVHRSATIRGTVRSAQADRTPARPRLVIAAGQMDSLESDTDGRPSAVHLWSLYESLCDVAVGADGRFEVRVPVVQGTRVAATGDDFRGSIGAVEFAPGRVTRPLELTLTPAPVVSGRLRTADGDPIRGATVWVFIVRRGRAADVSAAEFRANGGATCVGRGDSFAATWARRATTDLRGMFEIAVPQRGRSTLVAQLAGHGVARRDLGDLDADTVGIDLVVAPATGTVVLRKGGAPLASTSLAVQDIARTTSGWSWATDAAGRARTDWLVVGSEYVVLEPGSAAGRRLAWTGADAIDIESLPPDDTKGGFWSHGMEVLPAPGPELGGVK